MEILLYYFKKNSFYLNNHITYYSIIYNAKNDNSIHQFILVNRRYIFFIIKINKTKR